MGPDNVTKRVIRAPSQYYSKSKDLNEKYRKDSDVCHIKGPEFIVRNRDPPRRLNLMKNGSKEKAVRTLSVVLLSGQQIDIECHPMNTTLADIFNVVVEEEKLVMQKYLALATIFQGEFYFPPPKTKLIKVAPKSWQCTKTVSDNPEGFSLYVQFLLYPKCDDVRFMPTPLLNAIYLQLRRDLIEGRILAPASTILTLSSLALQSEFGISSQKDGDYFILEHYVPESLCGNRSAVSAQLKDLHESVKVAPHLAKVHFVNRIQSSFSYGLRLYRGSKEKGKNRVWIGLLPDGVTIMEDDATFESLLNTELIKWDAIKKIDCSTKKLLIYAKCFDKSRKIRLYLSHQRAACVAYASKCVQRYYQMSMATTNSGQLSTSLHMKSSSEVNLHRPDHIDYAPSPIGPLCDRDAIRENRNNLQKTNLSKSCLQINESVTLTKNVSNLKRRFASFAAADFVTRKKSPPAESPPLSLCDETEELLENLESGVTDEPVTSKSRVTYFPADDEKPPSRSCSSAGSFDKLDVTPDHSVFGDQSPRRCSCGVKMGTRVIGAFNKEHKSKCNRSLETISTSSDSTQPPPVVIEPNSTWNPVVAIDESVNDSLVTRLMDAGDDSAFEGERRLTTISLVKENGCLGICLSQALDNAFYIQAVTAGGVADRQGCLRSGDRLVGVNGRSVENLSYEKAVCLLKTAASPVELLVSQPVSKPPTITQVISPGANGLTKRHVTVINISTNEPQHSVRTSAFKVTTV